MRLVSSLRPVPAAVPRLRGWAAALVLAVVAWPGFGAASARAVAPSSPFHRTALWLAQVPGPASAVPLARLAVASGARALYVKAADGTTPDPRFTPGLVQGLRAGGVSVCAWTFAYGADPRGEAAAAVAAVRAGAQCLVVDAEGQYDKRYGAAQIFVRALRSHLRHGFPIGLAGQADVARHPTFPYSVFLGPGGFDVDLPQMYWRDLHQSVDTAYRIAIAANAVYGRPIVPVGQLYGAPSAAAVTRFRTLATAYGCPGVSFFSLDAAAPAGLTALRTRLRRSARRPAFAATVRPGADGDQVVWAQELLNAAGARLPVGGFFGAQTSRAVAAFEVRHGLTADGVLGPATWRVLLRFRAQEPSWATAPPQSARG